MVNAPVRKNAPMSVSMASVNASMEIKQQRPAANSIVIHALSSVNRRDAKGQMCVRVVSAVRRISVWPSVSKVNVDVRVMAIKHVDKSVIAEFGLSRNPVKRGWAVWMVSAWMVPSMNALVLMPFAVTVTRSYAAVSLMPILLWNGVLVSRAPKENSVAMACVVPTVRMNAKLVSKAVNGVA